VDFGIAKVYDPQLKTTIGARGVTPGFSPPEQYGQEKTDSRTDIYALGATLYALLTGLDPPDSVDIMTGSVSPPPPARQINPGISPALDAAIGGAMQLERARRYQTAAAFKAVLTAPRQSPRVTATPPAPLQSPTAAPGVPPLSIPWRWIGLAGLLVIAGLVIGSLVGSPVPEQPAFVATQTILTLVPHATLTPSLPSTTHLPPTTTLTSTPASTHTPTLASYPSQIIDDYGIPMVLVPAGPFEMGSDADVALRECQELHIDGYCPRRYFEDEEPVHTVTLDDYYIDQYEVTNAHYAACVDAGVCNRPSRQRSIYSSTYYFDTAYEDYPVIYLSWQDAHTYCMWRGVRLPTESEWEKAARGTEGWLYPWGDSFEGDRANFCDSNCTFPGANNDYDDGYQDIAPVGSYAPNGYGLYDMAGNVWEYVADWYDADYYASSPFRNPSGPTSGESRVIRGGGAAYSSGDDLRTTNRGSASPDWALEPRGFRCARSP